MKFHIRRSVILVAILAFAQLAGVLATSAKVRVQERTKYYNVTGKTGKQLMRSMTRRGPKIRRKGHVLATTFYKVDAVNIRSRIKGRKCVLRRGDIKLETVYTYPRWRGAKRASPKLRKAWRRFMAQLRKHERTHGRIAREYAQAMHKELRRATGSASKRCRDFGRRSIRKIKSLGRRYNRKQDRFDRLENRASTRIRRAQRILVNSR